MKLTLSVGELTVRHLTLQDVMAISQFGRQCMIAGIDKKDLEGLASSDVSPLKVAQLLWDKLAESNGEIGCETPLWQALYRLLEILTGWDGPTVRKLLPDDLFALGEAILERERVTRVGGFLRQTIQNTFQPYLVLLMRSTENRHAENPMDEAARSGSISNPGGGTNNGGGIPPSDLSLSEPDGPSIPSMPCPGENSNDSPSASPAPMS